jgi:hypothetical protein
MMTDSPVYNPSVTELLMRFEDLLMIAALIGLMIYIVREGRKVIRDGGDDESFRF